MERFIKGDVVIIPFPFSDLSGSKKRPAMVLVDLQGEDVMLCQITSQPKDNTSVPLTTKDFSSGTLPVNSYIRPTRIFTADKSTIIRKAGAAKSVITQAVVKSIIEMLSK